MSKNNKNAAANIDSVILKQIIADEELSIGSKRLNAFSDILVLFLSQRVSSVINDIINSMGLDGRVDVLIFLVALSIVTFYVYAYIQKTISSWNKQSKLLIMAKSGIDTQFPATRQHGKNITNILSSSLSSNYILYKHNFVWRRFLVSYVEFFTMVSGILMTYYSQQCLTLFLSNFNVSVYTMILPTVVIFIYIMALKTTFLGYASDGDFEKYFTVQDLLDFVDRQKYEDNNI